jgi:hypothetical protein
VCLLRGTICPHSVFMCFVWIWEQTAIISLYSINWLVFITETVCVYCTVRSAHTVYLFFFCTDLRTNSYYFLYRIDWLVFCARSQNCEKHLLASSCASVHPSISSSFRMDLGFHWMDFDKKIIVELFVSKICLENWSVIRIWHVQLVLYIKTYVHLWQCLAEFFLEWEMFQT